MKVEVLSKTSSPITVHMIKNWMKTLSMSILYLTASYEIVTIERYIPIQFSYAVMQQF